MTHNFTNHSFMASSCCAFTLQSASPLHFNKYPSSTIVNIGLLGFRSACVQRLVLVFTGAPCCCGGAQFVPDEKCGRPQGTRSDHPEAGFPISTPSACQESGIAFASDELHTTLSFFLSFFLNSFGGASLHLPTHLDVPT